jgi:hypothetical protein
VPSNPEETIEQARQSLIDEMGKAIYGHFKDQFRLGRRLPSDQLQLSKRIAEYIMGSDITHRMVNFEEAVAQRVAALERVDDPIADQKEIGWPH